MQKKMAAGLTRDIKLQALKLSFDSAAEIAKEIAIHLSVAAEWQQFWLTLTEQFLQHLNEVTCQFLCGRYLPRLTSTYTIS